MVVSSSVSIFDPDRLCSKILQLAHQFAQTNANKSSNSSSNSSNNLKSPPLVSVDLTPTRPLTAMISFLLIAIKFWQPLGEEASEVEDNARLSAFQRQFPDMTWNRMFDIFQQVEQSTSDLIERFKTRVELTEFLQKRLDILRELQDKAQAYQQEFANDLQESYSTTFFKSVHIVQDQAIARWAEWADTLAHSARDLMIFGAVLDAFEHAGCPLLVTDSNTKDKNVAEENKTSVATTTTTNSKQIARFVFCMENNLILSCAELLPLLGFQCDSFGGCVERIVPNTPMDKPSEFEKNMLEKILADPFSHRGRLIWFWAL